MCYNRNNSFAALRGDFQKKGGPAMKVFFKLLALLAAAAAAAVLLLQPGPARYVQVDQPEDEEDF